MRFEQINSAEAWQAALEQLPNPHPLQSWVWGAFKARWGWSAAPYLFFRDNGSQERPAAAALVLKRRLPRLPLSILYVPRGPILDYTDDALRRAILSQLEQIAHREKAIFIKIDPEVAYNRGLDDESEPVTTGITLKELLAGRGWRFSDDQIQFRNTVELDLTPPADDLLAAMKQKTRYNIRLAGRKGVTVRAGTAADFPLIEAMYRETADRDGFAIRPQAYYLDAWQSFYEGGLARPLIAEYEQQPLGAVIILRLGQRAIYMYGASNDLERRRMPNYLLQWEAIRWAQEAGCQIYDFWGAPDEFVESDRMWGVWRFKAGFGAQVVRHIGAWDYPARPFWYWLYTNAMPRYLNLLRRRSKEKILSSQ